jgi:3D (Asp-Asp-Asp) domain-containing protein
MNQNISLGSVASDAGLTSLNAAHGSNAPFPSMNENALGTYGGSGFGTFNSASFSNGTLTLSMTNSWPVAVTMGIDLVNTATGATILSYTLANVAANGGVGSNTKSLINKSLPNTVGFKITSLSSPGSGTTSVGIDTTDNLALAISSADLEVYSAVAQVSTQDISSDTQYVDLSTGGSEELHELMFNTASFDFEFTSSLAEDLQLSLAFPGSDKNGVEVDTTITIGAGSTTTGSINLNNTLLDLTQDPTQNHSRLPIAVSATLVGSGNMVSIDSSDALDMTFEMSNLSFGHIKGFFGTQQIVIDPGNVDLAIDFLNNFNGSISFAEPSISMDISNSIGIPIQLVLDFKSYSNGTAFPLNGPDFVLPFPTTMGNTSTGTLTYNNSNSSIVDVFTLPKDSISYGGAVNVNHDPTTFGTNNFVTSSSAISGDLLMELPFYFTAGGLGFSDTLASGLDNASLLSDSLSITYAKLLLQTTTTLPLDANVTLKFYDAQGIEILTKNLGLMESGTPNTNGIITTPNVLNTELELNAADVAQVLEATTIVAEALMETYNAGNDPVKLRTDATLNLSLGLEFKVSVIQ